jgi:hypothetical protein
LAEGAGDEIAKLRAEIARLRKTADGQIRSRVAEDIAVESAWERCGITPHWPDDEAGSIVSHAESMAMEIARLREERRWVSVEERLPRRQSGGVLTARGPWEDGGYSFGIGWWNGECWMSYGSDRDMPSVAFWMPLPPGPEGDG